MEANLEILNMVPTRNIRSWGKEKYRLHQCCKNKVCKNVTQNGVLYIYRGRFKVKGVRHKEEKYIRNRKFFELSELKNGCILNLKEAGIFCFKTKSTYFTWK